MIRYIICVGVGDGCWGLIEKFDDELPARKFDNFQFVPFADIMKKAENREVSFRFDLIFDMNQL
jgi:E3 ubiquitin-protein ligase RGLG